MGWELWRGGVGLIRVGHVLGEELLHFWGQEL